jgi:hypothetical protein
VSGRFEHQNMSVEIEYFVPARQRNFGSSFSFQPPATSFQLPAFSLFLPIWTIKLAVWRLRANESG